MLNNIHGKFVILALPSPAQVLLWSWCRTGLKYYEFHSQPFVGLSRSVSHLWTGWENSCLTICRTSEKEANRRREF